MSDVCPVTRVCATSGTSGTVRRDEVVEETPPSPPDAPKKKNNGHGGRRIKGVSLKGPKTKARCAVALTSLPLFLLVYPQTSSSSGC